MGGRRKRLGGWELHIIPDDLAIKRYNSSPKERQIGDVAIESNTDQTAMHAHADAICHQTETTKSSMSEKTATGEVPFNYCRDKTGMPSHPRTSPSFSNEHTEN